jgi:hypothetical protein
MWFPAIHFSLVFWGMSLAMFLWIGVKVVNLATSSSFHVPLVGQCHNVPLTLFILMYESCTVHFERGSSLLYHFYQ